MDVARLHQIAASQRGLVAVRQGRGSIAKHEALVAHLTRRGWTNVARGVWLCPGAPKPEDLAMRAAILSVGPPVAVARWSAAGLHGLHPTQPITQLIVPNTRRASGLRHVQTLRTRTWDDADITSVRGIPVTSMARTVCDLAAVAGLTALRQLMIDGRQHRRLELVDLVGQLARAGRIRGRRKVERLLGELDHERVDSEFERLVIAWLRSEGFDVVAQYPLKTPTRVIHLDIAIVDAQTGIECNGFGSHHERRHLNVDAKRVRAAQQVGWRLIPITWDDYAHGRAAFREDLDGILTGRL